jgi:hypothetical protein
MFDAFHKKPGGIFFSSSKEYAEHFRKASITEDNPDYTPGNPVNGGMFKTKVVAGPTYPVYLNIKYDASYEYGVDYNNIEYGPEDDNWDHYDEEMYNDQHSEHFEPSTYNGPSDENYVSLHKDFVLYFLRNNKEISEIKNVGIIGKDVNSNHSGYEYAVLNPTQAKHVENLGTFNPNDPNVYHAKITKNIDALNAELGLLNQFSTSSGSSVFGADSFSKLVQGEAVSSSDVLRSILNSKIISPSNKTFAEIV